MTEHINPEFFKALAHYKNMVQQYGEDHPITLQAFMHTFELSPQSLKDEAYEMAKDYLPKATHCNDQGEAVYSVQQLADHFEVSCEDVEEHIAQIQQIKSDHVRLANTPVHKIQ